MKILVLPSWYPNKSSNLGSFFIEQACFLNSNGYDVKVLMVEELHTKSYCFHRVKRLLQGKFNKLSTSFLQQNPDAFSFPVIIQKSWSDEKKLQVLDKAYLTAFKKLTKNLDWIPDVIHLQGMFKYGLSSYLISEVHQIPLVVIEHSPFKMANYSMCQQTRIQDLFQVARKVAGVSHFHKACLSVVDTKRELEVVWNFMDEKRFTLINAGKSEDVFIVTTILRASYVKDPITFFEAILKFVDSCDMDRPLEIHVVGISELDELLTMKGVDVDIVAKYQAISGIFNFHSWLNRDAVKTLHEKSSVFVSTSTDEPYGVAIREAMLCGVPVISTRSGGPEDTVGEGLLVDIGDAAGIAVKLGALYNGTLHFESEQLRQQVILQSGRQTFLKRMTVFYDV